MISELLKILNDFREVSEKSKFEEAHNITMILTDLNKYKSMFEGVLKEQTQQYYSQKAK